MAKVYSADRQKFDTQVLVNVFPDDGKGEGRGYFLPVRLDLFNHSPTGFEWGYRGSGPAQLALAMLADFLGNDQEALELYQEFKEIMIARFTGVRWSIHGAYVRWAVETIRKRHAETRRNWEEMSAADQALIVEERR